MRQRLHERQDEASEDEVAHDDEHDRCRRKIGEQQAGLAPGMFLAVEEVHRAGSHGSKNCGGGKYSWRPG